MLAEADLVDIQASFAPSTKVVVHGIGYIVQRHFSRESIGAVMSWKRLHDGKFLIVKLVPRGTAKSEDALMVEPLIMRFCRSQSDSYLLASCVHNVGMIEDRAGASDLLGQMCMYFVVVEFTIHVVVSVLFPLLCSIAVSVVLHFFTLLYIVCVDSMMVRRFWSNLVVV